jgi:predicted permease
LLRRLPFANPDRLVHVVETTLSNASDFADVSYPDYLDWRTRSRTLTALGGYYTTGFVFGSEPSTATFGVHVTANFFDVLGIRPAFGRAFTDGEDAPGAPAVAMISYGLWGRAFAFDKQAIGKTITIDGRPTTLVGVLPKDFRFRDNASDIWTPLATPQRAREQRGNRWLRVVGRLRDGATIDGARTELSSVMQDLARQYPRSNANHGAMVTSLSEDLVGSVRPLMLALYGAVAMLFLVACVNVANLLLMRGADREREIGVRIALGAGRARLIRQLLTESLVLGLIGGGLGLALARGGLRGLLRAIPAARLNSIPGLAMASIDGGVLLYVAVMSVAAVLVFGLVPALRSTQIVTSLRKHDRSTTRGGGLLRDGLVIVEVALAVLLVASAGLFGRSLMKLLAIQPGFRSDHLTTAAIIPAGPSYVTAEPRADFYRRIVERLHTVPGVDAVGLVSDLPLQSGARFYYDVAGRAAPVAGQSLSANVRMANAEYLRAFGIPLLEGRAFDASDDDRSAHVALIDRALAEREFHGEQPIGRFLQHFYFDDSVRIVGIVGNVPVGNLEAPSSPTIYLSNAQAPQLSMKIGVRSAGNTASVEAAIRDAVRSADPTAAVTQILSMDEVLAESPSVFLRRFPLVIVGAFAATTLLLALVGVYGVVSYSIRQRTRELGIRVALGAQRDNVMGLVLRHGVRIAAIGAGVGLLLTLVVSRFVSGMLYGIGARDPATLAMSVVVLAGAALAATIIPARRATRVDPTVALRTE